jgi:hypothetical protein
VGAFHLPGAPLFWRLGGGQLVHRALVRLGELPAGSTPSPSLGREGANGVRLYRANFLRRIARPGERRTDVPVQLVVPDGDRFLTPTLLSDVERWAPNLVRRPVEGRHWLPRLAPTDVARWVAAFVDEVEAATTGGVDRSARTPGIDRVEGVRALHPAPTPAQTPPAAGTGR